VKGKELLGAKILERPREMPLISKSTMVIE
jgi:hypothetical protein